MREGFFILLVIFSLLAWTAFRYRKQISSLIGFARMLKETKDSVTKRSKTISRESEKSIPLVNCAKCGIWVPMSKAVKTGDIFYCSDECL